jgi:hypothetical protein
LFFPGGLDVSARDTRSCVLEMFWIRFGAEISIRGEILGAQFGQYGA